MLCRKHFGGTCPHKGMGTVPVVPLDVEQNVIYQIFHRVPDSAFDDVASKDVESDFDSVL
jgi:hypothetical protein